MEFTKDYYYLYILLQHEHISNIPQHSSLYATVNLSILFTFCIYTESWIHFTIFFVVETPPQPDRGETFHNGRN